MENIQAITLDWLSLYCLGTIKDRQHFLFIKQNYSTRQFKSVYQIFYKKKSIGTATADPASKIINPKAIIIKFDNDLLYSRSARYFIQKFLKSTKIFFKSITRADIARDFLRFSNNLNPLKFIQDFFKQIYLKNGRGKFTAIGEQMTENIYDYLRFGSRTTGRMIYLYNKSKEMREVKPKKHIKMFWERNGLNTGADVWRLEFSFKGSQNKLVDTITGLIEKIDWKDLFKIEKLSEILNTAINQLFSFKIADGTKNKTRMKDLKLFENIDTGIKLVKLPDKEDKIKPLKILLKNMVKEYEQTPKANHKELFTLHFSILSIAQNHQLLTYLRKQIGFHSEYYPNPFTGELVGSEISMFK